MERDVSVIICVRNSAEMLARCIETVRANKPREIIVVDGDSSDGSFEIAKEQADLVLKDGGRGISYARKLGTEAANGYYVLHMGPDNIMPANFLQDFVRMAAENGYHGTGAQTKLDQVKTFWDKGLDDWWQFARGDIGPRRIIGTPCLFEREILIREPFSEDPLACDDTELCERLTDKGYRLGIVPLAMLDSSERKWKDVYQKFFGYGCSDADYYWLHQSEWTFTRKLVSLGHPFRQTVRGLVWARKNRCSVQTLAFITIIGLIRYYGYFMRGFNREVKT